MAKWTFKGLDALVSKYQQLSDKAHEGIGDAVYAGAGLVADAVKAETQKLPVNNAYESDGITSVQKAGLVEGFGISRMRDDNGYLNVKLGFDGYNGQKTKQYPDGQPNSIIARSVNSGTSFRRKNPFVDRATKATKSACERAMADKLDKSIQRIIGGT